MPSAPLKPCLHPGCPALITKGPRCDAHTKHNAGAAYDATKRRDDPRLAEAARIRNSAQWQAVRLLHRRLEPLCRDPFNAHEGWPVPTTDSHHIAPLATHPALAFDLSNLAGLCQACHRRIEALERVGCATAGLFRK